MRGDGGITHDRTRDRYIATLDLGWDDGKRRRIYRVAKLKSEAQRLLMDLKAQYITGGLALGPNTPFGALYDQWLKDTTTLKYGTIRQRQWLRQYIRGAIATMPAQRLNAGHIEKLLRDASVAGLSPQSCQHLRDAIRACLNYARRQNIVVKNVCVGVPLPKRVETKEAYNLTVSEAKQFLRAAAKDKNAVLYFLAIATGMRMGELLGLGADDVDLKAGTINVRSQVQRARSGIELGTPKWGSKRDALQIPVELVERLRRHKRQLALHKAAAGSRWREHGLLFPTSLGTPIEQSNFHRRSFYVVMQDAKTIPYRAKHKCPTNSEPDPKHRLCRYLRLHDLRHSSITFALASGVPPHVVMRQAGHTQWRTFERYSGVTPAQKKLAAAAMGRIVGPIRATEFQQAPPGGRRPAVRGAKGDAHSAARIERLA